MKAKDLRIGNYYLYKGKEIKFDLSDFKEIDHNLLDLLKPIPLTEGWLLKFGLNRKGYNEDDNEVFAINDDVWIIRYISDGYYLDGYDNEIKYVNQLQNLYFALFSKELTIK